MSRPPVEIRRARTPQQAKDRMRRHAADACARAALERLDADLQGRGPEFALEVERALVRRLTPRMADRASEGRCVGILAGAMAEIAPAYVGRHGKAKDDAEAAFKGEAA